MKLPRWFMIGLFLAFIVRLALIPNPGFEADVSFWKAWGLAVVDKGIIEGLKVSNSNYPTPFMYVLGAMVWIYKLFANPHNFNQFWTNTNLLFLTISKTLPILADFGIAGIILWIVKCHSGLDPESILKNLDPRLRGDDRKGRGDDSLRRFSRSSHFPYILALAYLLSPIALIDGAWWGQVDSVGVFLFLVAVFLALKKLPMLAGVIYMAGVMTKLQNMIYGPVFFLFLWQTLGYAGLVRAIAGSTIAFFGLNIEFFLSRNMDRVIASLTENYDYFPLMSLNAYNLWWIVSGAKGMAVSDKFLALGIMNAKTVGLVLFASVYLFTVLRQVSLQKFIESLILVNAAFFLLQTQSHDRYAFPLSVFLLLWKPVIRFPMFYFLFSLFYFYNLHTALVVNYPNNGIPWLSGLTQPFFTITTSVVLLSLFAIFLVYLIKRSHPVSFLLPFTFLLFAFAASNLPLFTKKPVSLTKLTPYVAEQGYGKRQTNMPVNAFLGFPKQSYLSVQYAFYRTGIGTHSPSFLNYDIGGHFEKFSTDYGIDTEAGGKGSAVFEIYGDDRLLFKSEKIGRYDLPRHTGVDVTGVKKLGLVTTDAGDGKDDDHTDWLNSQLWP